MKSLPLIILLLSLTVGTVLCAPQPKPSWPKGIDPATLLPNTDVEPDLAPSGFVDLFNGTDLSGWSVKGGAMQFEVKEGVLVGTCVPKQPNGFLCTDETYGNFIFTAEFKWEVLGNSGIMFRADTRSEKGRSRVFGYQSEMDQTERGWTGGIYGERMGGWKVPLSKPEGHAAARAAVQDHTAWNRMTIQAVGSVMKTWINGIPCAHLVDDERSEGFFGLQVHSGQEGRIHWRNLRVKKIKNSDEWIDLFAEGTFAQWTALSGGSVPSGWSIENGIIHRADPRPGDIITQARYKDFELTFDWKISAGGNSGVKYRTRGSLGLEYQILDDTQHRDRKNPTHRAASLYEIMAAPDDKPIHPAGHWNQARIVANGPVLEHWLNGVRVVRLDQSSAEWLERFAKSKYRATKNFGAEAGSILLQDHGDEAWYRNVRIRELTN